MDMLLSTGCVKIKRLNTKPAISQKCVNIFAPNFYSSYNCPQVWCFILYLLDVCRNNGNVNLKDEFCNRTNVDFSKSTSSSCLWELCDVKNHPILWFWRMKSWGNLTAEDTEFAHLTYCGRSTYKSVKNIFNNVIHVWIRMFRLLGLGLLKNGFQLYATVREVTSYKVFEVTSVCADTTTESVTPLFDRVTHARCSAGIQSMS